MSKQKKSKKQGVISFSKLSDIPYTTLSSGTMEWNHTGSWRYMQPAYVERIPACQASCPTSNNIETWIRLMEEGDFKSAWEFATVENPFPAIMGRVCFHPCTKGCNRMDMGGSVNICMLERYLADHFENTLPVPMPFFKETNQHIAVIGSGPAGLSCAYHLRRLGHKVTVFEKEKDAGGMLRYGIPQYRLPHDILTAEIKRLEKMGITIKINTPIRDAACVQELRQDYNAIFLAIGAWKSKPFPLENDKKLITMSGLSFLKDIAYNRRPRIGKKIIVVGGGNTAIDTARTAKRLGADVTVVYRRTYEEMPASIEEIHHAKEEGVRFELLCQPVRVEETGKKTSVLCQKMILGPVDDTGRRMPVPMPGDTMTIPADTILTAIGETIDNTIIPSKLPMKNGSLCANNYGQTEWTNIFAGGDLIESPRTVVDALASGKRSAIAIDCVLRGEGDSIDEIVSNVCVPNSPYIMMSQYVMYRDGAIQPAATTSKTNQLSTIVYFKDLNLAYFKESMPYPTPVIPVKDRISAQSFVEVSTRPTKEMADYEMARCFHCGRCTLCDNCYIYCPDVAINKIKDGFKIDMDYCKGCGICVTECPRAAMQMIDEQACNSSDK